MPSFEISGKQAISPAARAIVDIGGAQADAVLVKAIDSPHRNVRDLAYQTLIRQKRAELMNLMIDHFDGPVPISAPAGPAGYIRAMRPASILPLLEAIRSHTNTVVRQQAALLAIRLSRAEAKVPLLAALRAGDSAIIVATYQTLLPWTEPADEAAARQWAKDHGVEVKTVTREELLIQRRLRTP
ncbi:MAG: hypothetical protein PHV34_19660 [Verrucomicrobiae bacterium]|nr:hypothetical protein [Verrucomicrobiae bacterium]